MNNVIALLFFLLPIAAFSGWVLGRRRSERKSGARVSELSTSYFRGLNYLLNEQQDKAIEVFLKLADINRDTVETHLALGNLFRRRGEVDRAIRVHQNLIARPSLSQEEKTVALLELGEDYMPTATSQSSIPACAQARNCSRNCSIRSSATPTRRMDRKVELGSEGGHYPLAFRDGNPSGYSLVLERLTYRDGNVPVLKLSVVDDRNGRTLAYAWANPEATRIGLSLGWVQVGLDRAVAPTR